MPTDFDLPSWVASWIAAGCAAVAAFLGAMLVLRMLRRSSAFPETPATSPRALVHRFLARVRLTSLLLLGLVAGAATYASLEPVDATTIAVVWSWVWKISVVAIAIQMVSWAGIVVDWGGNLWVRHHSAAEGRPDPAIVGAMGTFRWVILLVVYAGILLLSLENLGVDVTALIAGLGVGGIAVALAVQNILGDLFGSLTITLDKPFVVGDFIVVGSEMGTIEKIGLKTTRVRSLGGEQLIFGNNDLLQSRIRNYKRMQERRIEFGFRVAMGTTPEQIEAVCRHVREIIDDERLARFDRCHFASFGESSLEIKVVYAVLSADFNVYMDVQQRINLEIMRRLAAEGVELPYPTQTVYVARARSHEEREQARERREMTPVRRETASGRGRGAGS